MKNVQKIGWLLVVVGILFKTINHAVGTKSLQGLRSERPPARAGSSGNRWGEQRWGWGRRSQTSAYPIVGGSI